MVERDSLQEIYNLVQTMTFGFEYETLVEVKNNMFLPLYQQLNTNRKHVQTCDISNSQPDTLTRFLLAAIFNLMSARHTFEAAKAYHGEPCPTFPLIPTKPAALQNSQATNYQQYQALNANMMDIDDGYRSPQTQKQRNTWVITFDRSVKQDNTVSLYTTFESLLMNSRNTPGKGNTLLEHIEIVSPILTWSDIKMNNVFQEFMNSVIRVNNSFEYWNNSTTSNHIHIACKDIFRTDPISLLKAAMAWWVFEPVFLLLVAPWRRGNGYCMATHAALDAKYGSDNARELFYNLNEDNYKAFLASLQLSDTVESVVALLQGVDLSSRYVAFNMLNIIKYGTLEVRLKQGSSDSKENTLFMELLAYFFASAIKNQSVNHSKHYPEHKHVLDLSWDLATQLIQTGYKLNNSYKQRCLELFHAMFAFMKLDNQHPLYKYWLQVFLVINDDRNERAISGGAKPTGYFNVFSYGSNSTEQLAKRVGRKGGLHPLPAYLNNHARIFAGFSKRWRGGIASIYPAKGVKVYGSIVQLTMSEIEQLDKFESGYTRVRIQVVCQQTNMPCNAFVYIKDNHKFTHLPSESYIQAIHKQLNDTARHHRSKILVRGLNNNGKLVTFATWQPNEGLTTKKEYHIFDTQSKK